jgi:hypothetical protein
VYKELTMSQLLLKPEPDVERTGDKVTAVPAPTARTTFTGMHRVGRRLHRRFSATRWLVEDNSFRPFRIY